MTTEPRHPSQPPQPPRRIVGGRGLGIGLVATLGILGASVAALTGNDGDTVATTSASSRPAATLTPTATTAPTSTRPTREQAAAIYVKAVTPANEAVEALDEAVDSKKDVATIRAKARAAAAANRAFLDVLLATDWPDVVAADAEELARVTAAEQSLFQRMTRVETTADAEATLYSDNFDTSSAQLIRAKLGLPPAEG
jgi:hypothetical protein